MADLMTAAFTFGAAMFLILNIRQLLIDKEVKGVSIYTISYFTTWGYWGIFLFYKMPNMLWTVFASVVLAVTYSVWLGLAIYYKKKAS